MAASASEARVDDVDAAATGAAAAAASGSCGGAPEPLVKRASAVEVVQYAGERDLPQIQALIDRDLSEPYSVFTYRYFLKQWPHLCFLAMTPSTAHAGGARSARECVGAVVCKLDMHKNGAYRGYIAMLAVRDDWRGAGLGTRLVRAAILAMKKELCDEVVLEAEITNTGALRLYEQLGFIRDKLLEKYYLNGNGAYRLKLRLRSFDGIPQ